MDEVKTVDPKTYQEPMGTIPYHEYWDSWS